MLVFVQMDTHEQTFSQNLFVLKNLKFLMPLDNSLFENNGRNATIQM
jgi:hypothetical protein